LERTTLQKDLAQIRPDRVSYGVGTVMPEFKNKQDKGTKELNTQDVVAPYNYAYCDVNDLVSTVNY
jgi:hypothetical protein